MSAPGVGTPHNQKAVTWLCGHSHLPPVGRGRRSSSNLPWQILMTASPLIAALTHSTVPWSGSNSVSEFSLLQTMLQPAPLSTSLRAPCGPRRGVVRPRGRPEAPEVPAGLLLWPSCGAKSTPQGPMGRHLSCTMGHLRCPCPHRSGPSNKISGFSSHLCECFTC